MRRALADPPARWKPAGAVHTRGVVGGRPAEIITPHGWVEGAPSILYLHGGGYGVGSPATHRALTTQLAVAAGFRCWVPHYRLAPEEPFPAAVDDAEAAWRELRAGTEAPCFVAGDSAGGGLTFALALRLKARGGPLPDGLVGLSPWTDLTMSGDSHAACAHADYLPMPLLQAFAGAYLGDGDRTAPEASPLCGELDGLPPCFVQHGGLEVLRWDSEELVRRLRAAGVDATLDAWPGMVHVFQAFGPLIPEGARAIERVGAWLKEQAAR
jgi:monoterpene epsilon-lactone hydrolase